MHCSEEITEQQTRISENPFNKHFQKDFYVNDYGEVVIKGIMPRIMISEKDQQRVINEVNALFLKKVLGEEPSYLEQLALHYLFENTH